MNHYFAIFLLGFCAFMVGVGWSVYYVINLANVEEPGCIHPGRHK